MNGHHYSGTRAAGRRSAAGTSIRRGLFDLPRERPGRADLMGGAEVADPDEPSGRHSRVAEPPVDRVRSHPSPAALPPADPPVVDHVPAGPADRRYASTGRRTGAESGPRPRSAAAVPPPAAAETEEPEDAGDRTAQGFHRRQLRVLLELRVIGMVVRRELKKYVRSKAKILSSFVQPFFFLLIFGYGMRTLVHTTGGVPFEQFVFPGVIAMTVLGRALLSAVTIVQDREHGFLREMLVSPASRVSIVIGSILGGAVISSIQAVLLFCGAPVMGLFPRPATIASVLAVTVVMSVEVTALGVALATFIQKPHSFQAVAQAITYPMLVLSGALVPLAGLPSWVNDIARFNIFSYPVDAIRRMLIGSDVGSDSGALTGMVLLGRHLSVADEVCLTAGCTVAFVVVAAWRFARVR